MKQNLQTSAIKSIFINLDHEQQIDLLYELMKLGNVDSIIQTTTRPRIRVDGVDGDPNVYNHPTYKELFIYWIYKFLPIHFTVIENNYLDRCFRVFEVITSTRTRPCKCRSKDGYCSSTDINASDLKPFTDEDMRIKGLLDLMGEETPDAIHICATFKDQNPDTLHRLDMNLYDLFILIYHQSDDEINVLLSTMGFLDGHAGLNHQDAIRVFPDLSWRTWKPAYFPGGN
jgi:hypothetical protein